MLLDRRNSMRSDQIRYASRRIHSSLKDIAVFAIARSVALYYPVGSEVQTQEIMAEAAGRGVQVLLPRVSRQRMIFCAVDGPKDLRQGTFGIMEPAEGCQKSDEMDVIVLPAVGVTMGGLRLGYGRGYYDRFLRGTDAATIALAYSHQVVPALPYEEHDIRVHWIVTENGAFRTDRAAAWEELQ